MSLRPSGGLQRRHSVAAYQLLKVIETINKAAMVANAASTMIFGVIPEVIALAHQLDVSPRLPLPAQPYRHSALAS